MKSLDSFSIWSPLLDECARRYLGAEDLEYYEAMPPEERQRQLAALLERPIETFSPVNEAYFRARWADTLRMLHSGADLSLMEVATGDADMIPQAMARSHLGSRYVTANMNRQLNESLLARTKGLDIRLELVDDDAARIAEHCAPASFDVVAFQHGINDVLQAILCAREGVDTVYSDWMAVLPRMIEMLQREMSEGTFEAHVKAPFLALLRTLADMLKPGGVIAANHYMFRLDLDWGYPPALFEGLVPLVRGWCAELTGLEEVRYPGYEENWWLFLRKR